MYVSQPDTVSVLESGLSYLKYHQFFTDTQTSQGIESTNFEDQITPLTATIGFSF